MDFKHYEEHQNIKNIDVKALTPEKTHECLSLSYNRLFYLYSRGGVLMSGYHHWSGGPFRGEMLFVKV